MVALSSHVAPDEVTPVKALDMSIHRTRPCEAFPPRRATRECQRSGIIVAAWEMGSECSALSGCAELDQDATGCQPSRRPRIPCPRPLDAARLKLARKGRSREAEKTAKERHRRASSRSGGGGVVGRCMRWMRLIQASVGQ